ncbi:hypothetical protein AOQ84DRAFT_373578 [Glonium stellatum]|uniref:Uncharacterized protein n=1 Tax=Glonium stellatum TaxID=574774 RepID=A0A8E2JWM1_9PEZI|nr:hypothetical protein AOQ84DRAFT_373578 [Glonium stellatum]
MTKRLEQLLLWSEGKRTPSSGKTVGESIKTIHFRADTEPVTLPFLAIEAKPKKRKDSYSGFEGQTAFTIPTLLNLQQELCDAADDEGESESSPRYSAPLLVNLFLHVSLTFPPPGA